MNENDILTMYETAKIRKISLELTDTALAVYLIKLKNYVPTIIGNEEVFYIGKKIEGCS